MEYKTAKEMHNYAEQQHQYNVNEELNNIFNKIAEACERGEMSVTIENNITKYALENLKKKGYVIIQLVGDLYKYYYLKNYIV